jgi:hypothetical protein
LLHVLAFDGAGMQAATPDLTVTSIADPGTSVSGAVIDPSGAGVAGATVTVAAQGGASATATSGADGSFTVPGLPTNQGFLDVSVSGTLGGCPAQAGTSVPPPPPGQTVFVGNLTLAPTSTSAPPTTTVTGTVLGLDGQGLAGVTVTVASGDLADTATAVSGAGGGFAVTGFPAGAWPMRAEATITPGGVMLFAVNQGRTVPVPGGTTDLGTLSLQPYPYTGPDPLTTVTGQVNNLDGSPAGGAEVVIDLGYAELVTTTAADGTFTVTGVPTLQGGIELAASVHLPCNVLNSTGIVNASPLNPGGVTPVGVLILAPDTGPPRD